MAKLNNHIFSDETGQRIALAVEAMAFGKSLQWDDKAGAYTSASIAAMLADRANGLCYGVQIPKGSATACTKVGANAGMQNPTPGTAGNPAQDPYFGLGAFYYIEVNATIDADGLPHVTGISGDGRFRRDGSNGDIWVLTPVLYWAYEDGEQSVTVRVSDKQQPGLAAQPGAFLPDSSMRPFMLYAKYPLSIVDGTARSMSGQKAQIRNVSHNSLITQCKNATTGYSGKTTADDWYVKVMFLLKYATKNSQSVFAGCTSYDVSAQPTVAEQNASRVIVSNSAAANFLVGSACMLGTNDPATTDRGNFKAYDVFDGLNIVRKEPYDDENTALYFDGNASFDTATTYKLFTRPWASGACDMVEGDGSPYNCLSGDEPFVMQGIEIGHGMYEVLGNVIISSDGSSGWEICVNHDSKNEATSVTDDYELTGKFIPAGSADAWNYPFWPDLAGDALLFGTGTGASQTTGMCDGTYSNKVSTSGTREWLSLGILRNGGNAGLWCVYGGGSLSSAWWGFGSRLSGIGRSKG